MCLAARPFRSRPRHGFSLIEAAIVLAVVGLVIGGIWVAASAAADSLKVKDFVSAITIACSRAQSVFPSWSASIGPGQSLITSSAFNAGLLPGSWSYGTGAPVWNTLLSVTPSIKSPIGEVVVSQQQQSSTPWPRSVRFSVFPITKAQCIRTLRTVAAQVAKYGNGQSGPIVGMTNSGYGGYDEQAGTVSSPTGYWYYLNGTNNVNGNATGIVNHNCSEYNFMQFFCAP